MTPYLDSPMRHLRVLGLPRVSLHSTSENTSSRIVVSTQPVLISVTREYHTTPQSSAQIRPTKKKESPDFCLLCIFGKDYLFSMPSLPFSAIPAGTSPFFFPVFLFAQATKGYPLGKLAPLAPLFRLSCEENFLPPSRPLRCDHPKLSLPLPALSLPEADDTSPTSEPASLSLCSLNRFSVAFLVDMAIPCDLGFFPLTFAKPFFSTLL